jgi:hypothetical protein
VLIGYTRVSDDQADGFWLLLHIYGAIAELEHQLEDRR